MPSLRKAGTTGLAVLFLLSGCATDLKSPHRQLRVIWQDYLEMADQRALAIAGDPRRNRWVTAASAGHSALSEAKESALSACRVRRRIRRLQPACRLYAVDDRIVWTHP